MVDSSFLHRDIWLSFIYLKLLFKAIHARSLYPIGKWLDHVGEFSEADHRLSTLYEHIHRSVDKLILTLQKKMYASHKYKS